MENTNEGEMTEKENEVVPGKRVDSCETVIVDDVPEEVEKDTTRLNQPATESNEEAGSVLGYDEEKQNECSDDVKESEVVQTSDQVDSSVSAVQEEKPSTGGEEGSSVQRDVSLEQSKEIESVVPVHEGDEVVSASGPDEVEIQEEKSAVVEEEKCESVVEEGHIQEEEISVPEEKCESVQEEESAPEVVQANEKPVSVEEMKADSVSEEVATAPVVEEEKPASIQEEHESVHEEVLPVDNPVPVHEEPQPAQTLASVQETTVPQPVKEETVSVHEENLQLTQEEKPQPSQENIPEGKSQPTQENPQHTKPSVLPQEEEKPAIPEDLPAEKPLNTTDSPLRPERNSNPPQHSRFLVARPPRAIHMNLRDIPSPSHTPGASALPVTPFSLNTSRDTTRLSTSNVVVKLREKKEDATEEGVPKWQEGRVTMLVLNMVDKTGNNVSVQRGSDV